MECFFPPTVKSTINMGQFPIIAQDWLCTDSPPNVIYSTSDNCFNKKKGEECPLKGMVTEAGCLRTVKKMCPSPCKESTPKVPTQVINKLSYPLHTKETNQKDTKGNPKLNAARPINDCIYDPAGTKENKYPNSTLEDFLPKHTSSTQSLNNHNTQNNPYTTMDLSDEQFIEQFASLSSEGTTSDPVNLPQSGLSTWVWEQCALLRIVTENSTIDHIFSATMMKAWGVDPATEISILTRNMFLVQFTNPDDMEKVLQRNIWTYRNDAVILKKIWGPSDLEQPKVDLVEVWTQWHRVPPANVSHVGLMLLAQKLGTPISDPIEMFAGGGGGTSSTKSRYY